MCGIAGAINQPFTEAVLDHIHHRGPDYRASFTKRVGEHQVFLGHTRLSILDLSAAGNQPMQSDCGRYVIVFNGEIYNHQELRSKLSGISFRGHSDTETILYYLREFGIDRVADFNGIFAFALLDLEHGKLHLARDHFGVKPLYYHNRNGSLSFASELKVLLSSGVDKSINLPALDTLLTLRYNPSPDTIYQHIRKLEPATYLSYDLDQDTVKKKTYYRPKYKIDEKITEHEAREEWARLFEQAVRRQLQSDVPVGLFLSGGLDSALVGRIMMQYTDRPIKTFTVGFKGEGNYNELADAQITADYIGSDHRAEFITEEEYLNYFRKSFYHTEEPIAEPTIPALYHVAKMASQDVKVVLSGQGADEPMAGYKRYYGERLLAKYVPVLRHVPHGLAQSILPGNETVQRGLYAARFRDELERFLAIYTLFPPALKARIYRKDLAPELRSDIQAYFAPFYSRVTGQGDSLNRLLYLDTRTMLPDNLLLFNDKITMAHSIENRVPFLDKDLVAFAETLPSHFKLRGKVRKYLEKEAAQRWLPTEMIHRKKRGFETPIGDWLKKGLADELADLFSQNDSFAARYFDRTALLELIQQHRTGKVNYQKQLYNLYSIELWYRNFYQQF